MPNGMFVHLSPHCGGSRHDLTIFKDQYHSHNKFTLEKGRDKELTVKNQEDWAILMNKG